MAWIGRSSKLHIQQFGIITFQTLKAMKIGVSPSSGMAIGIALGLMVGIATDNIALWLCIGVALGAAYEGKSKVKKDKEEK